MHFVLSETKVQGVSKTLDKWYIWKKNRTYKKIIFYHPQTNIQGHQYIFEKVPKATRDCQQKLTLEANEMFMSKECTVSYKILIPNNGFFLRYHLQRQLSIINHCMLDVSWRCSCWRSIRTCLIIIILFHSQKW